MKYKLNHPLIKHATCKPGGKPLNLSDGGGLYLHIKKHSKLWRYPASHTKKYLKKLHTTCVLLREPST